ncbi:DNA repair protein RecO [Rhizobium sp. LjRoot254]|uniref:DNA repair protein RecO n=1 Tax=Rhizobium sp. LjRoot254 TaxID=3342297 RepID=UPI003ECFC258
MQWQDEAIILGVRRHGETSVIAEVMTRERGRHLGLVRNGRSRTMQPVLQPGNLVEVTWRARLDEHLGNFSTEPLSLRAATLMEHAASLHGVQALAALLRLLPERDPHPHLFEMLNIVLDHLGEASGAGELYIRFELAVLNDLGFGLDLLQCAATGTREQLEFVSPKSGRAVSRDAGLPYQDKLFRLPEFLKEGSRESADRESLGEAFRLTQYFLNRHVYEPRGLEPGTARDGFIRAVLDELVLEDHMPEKSSP